MNREKLALKTMEQSEVIDITEKVNELLSAKKVTGGLISLFLMHTTAALVTSAFDPKTDLDILDTLEMTVPAYYSHLNHRAKVPHHIIASFLTSSLVIPIENGKLLLGEMQRIMLIELNGPKQRNITVDFIKN